LKTKTARPKHRSARETPTMVASDDCACAPGSMRSTNNAGAGAQVGRDLSGRKRLDYNGPWFVGFGPSQS
jgi:hypothetical protein